MEPLCISFPSLFALAISKDAWVADVWNFEGKRGGWAPCFSRSFNDWEAERVKRFLLKIQTKRAYRDEEDRMIWMALRCWNFLVKSLYSIMEPETLYCSPRSIIWRSYVSPRVVFFPWEATWGKALTLDEVQMRGFSLANRCFLCHSEEEIVDHILLHCAKTWIL